MKINLAKLVILHLSIRALTNSFVNSTRRKNCFQYWGVIAAQVGSWEISWILQRFSSSLCRSPRSSHRSSRLMQKSTKFVRRFLRTLEEFCVPAHTFKLHPIIFVVLRKNLNFFVTAWIMRVKLSKVKARYTMRCLYLITVADIQQDSATCRRSFAEKEQFAKYSVWKQH